MKRMKPVLWIAFGLILGVAARFLPSQVHAQSATPPTVDKRLTVNPAASTEWLRMYFVSDPKSGGCWLASHAPNTGAFSAMVVAPPSACVFK